MSRRHSSIRKAIRGLREVNLKTRAANLLSTWLISFTSISHTLNGYFLTIMLQCTENKLFLNVYISYGVKNTSVNRQDSLQSYRTGCLNFENNFIWERKLCARRYLRLFRKLTPLLWFKTFWKSRNGSGPMSASGTKQGVSNLALQNL